MKGLRVGVLAPHTGRAAGPASLAEVAAAAEALGYSSLWVGDHVLLPADQRSAYPYGGEDADDSYEVPSDRPFLEAFCTLNYLAAVTERCAIGVSVTIVPYRHPAMLAKLIGTTNLLSGGRLIFGVGTGWLAEEFDALGSDFPTRGARTDETLDFLRHAWTHDGPISYPGKYVRFTDMHVNPGTGQQAAPKVWVGGNGALSWRRTAKYGDVWHPHVRGLPPQALRAGLDAIDEQAESHGRSPGFTGALHAPLLLTGEVGGEPWQLGRFEGPPSYVADMLAQYRDAGLEHVVLTFGGSPARRIETMKRLAEVVLIEEVASR